MKQSDKIKQKALDIIKDELEKAGIRKYVCANGWGHSQTERDIADRIIKMAQEGLVSRKKIFKATLNAVNLGMQIRQDQLSGYGNKSGKELHKEWFDENF